LSKCLAINPSRPAALPRLRATVLANAGEETASSV